MTRSWVEAVLHLFGKFKVININTIITLGRGGPKVSVICGRNKRSSLPVHIDKACLFSARYQGAHRQF